jgi:hypothetical protein
MKKIALMFVFSLTLFSCDKDGNNPTLEDFCSVAPTDWECEIIKDNFSRSDIPQNTDNPIAIIKYTNPSREFTRFDGTKVNPPFILDLYSIRQKEELIDFIKSQQMYSWCIPIYYGETKDYFIITSPCFINGASFTDEADSCISDLHAALKGIITINDYDFIGE